MLEVTVTRSLYLAPTVPLMVKLPKVHSPETALDASVPVIVAPFNEPLSNSGRSDSTQVPVAELTFCPCELTNQIFIGGFVAV